MSFYPSTHLIPLFSDSFTRAVFTLLLLSLLTACDNNSEPAEQPIRTVRVAPVSTNNTLVKRRFTGRIEAVSTIDLSFQVPGHLQELPAQEGAFIARGGLLAALDNNDFRLAVQQAQAQFDLAKLDRNRKRNLLKSGSLPKAMLDQAETQYTLTQVALATAQRNLSYTRIFAPFDALVSDRLIDNFTNVNAHQPIVRIHDLTELRVAINIPENMVPLLEYTSLFTALATFKDRPDQSFPLIYREHRSEAGNIAQTYEIIFGLSRENNEHVLPGMTVIVTISKDQGEHAPHFSIPVGALNYDEQGAPRVWVFDPATQTVSARSVTLGAMKKLTVPVISGLQQDDLIVTAGAHLLREGMTVRRFVSF